MTYSHTYILRDNRSPFDSGFIFWIGIATITVLLLFVQLATPNHHRASSHVLLTDAVGHGSGVYLGKGLILTAAHVPDKDTSMTLKTDKGSTQTATVLWQNSAYDIALLKVADDDSIAPAALSCSSNYDGQHVHSYGNPIDLQFIHTSGEVVGSARPIGPWKIAVPTDIAVGPGQSGGAVVDDNGAVVGIMVGMQSSPFGVIGISYFVPASAVCELLAR